LYPGDKLYCECSDEKARAIERNLAQQIPGVAEGFRVKKAGKMYANHRNGDDI